MLLRNKNLECIVPRRSSMVGEQRRTMNGRVDHTPAAPFPDPLLERSMAEAGCSDEQPRFKLMVFRMSETLKTDFKMALLKNHVDVQHTFEAFSEIFIAWTAGEKIPDPMKAIIRRTVTLMNGV